MKKGEISMEMGHVNKPTKKSRVSEMGEEKASPPREVQMEPKVYVVDHGFEREPKNWDFEQEEGDFSDDDDEDSIRMKRLNCDKQKVFMSNWAKSCSASIRGKCNLNQPFNSYGSGFNNSMQLFGSPDLFLEDYEEELARRVLIMRKWYLEECQSTILLYVRLSDELAEGRDSTIPNNDST